MSIRSLSASTIGALWPLPVTPSWADVIGALLAGIRIADFFTGFLSFVFPTSVSLVFLLFPFFYFATNSERGSPYTIQSIDGGGARVAQPNFRTIRSSPTSIVKSPDDWSTPHSSTVDVPVTAAHPRTRPLFTSARLARAATLSRRALRDIIIYVLALIDEYRHPTSLACASIFELERALALHHPFLDTLCLNIGVRGVPGTPCIREAAGTSSRRQVSRRVLRTRIGAGGQMKDGRGTRKAFEGGRQFSDSRGPLIPSSVVA
ncbi:hypothetical protein DFH08DRAFT_1026041 [Mycena albidolilacea]|uniref:Uncharacterized protein n=1 Tax=Mycena albidolilacea TaxID=1033008 RepID=A0AAD6ZL78_9AGAR|nr:hypothetical protein DFH08DRAFT_1026041 [Mycena albidolilacea]